MKTIKLKTTPRNAQKAGVLLYSLEMPILLSWTEEELMSDVSIYIICKLDEENSGIPIDLRLEKIKESNLFKIL